MENIYKTSTAYTAATDRNNGAAAIWCQPIYWDMAMNASKLSLIHIFSVICCSQSVFGQKANQQPKTSGNPVFPGWYACLLYTSQPSEPAQPLFGSMKYTSLMPELQITQEYTGHSTYLVYLCLLYTSRCV